MGRAGGEMERGRADVQGSRLVLREGWDGSSRTLGLKEPPLYSQLCFQGAL